MSSITLTKKTFDSCRRDKSGTKIRRVKAWFESFSDELSEKLESYKEFDTLRKNLKICRIWEQGRKRYRSEMWIGTGTKQYLNRRGLKDHKCGVQFQFAFGKDGVWANGIWIEGRGNARKAKEKAWRSVDCWRTSFEEALHRLSADFRVNTWGKQQDWGKRCRDFDSEDVDRLIDDIRDPHIYVHIGRPWSRANALRLGGRLSSHVTRGFARLWPIYERLTANISGLASSSRKREKSAIFTSAPPKRPVFTRKARTESDPVQKQIALERATLQHNVILKRLAKTMEGNGVKPQYGTGDIAKVDIYDKRGDRHYIFEIKSCRGGHMHGAIRLGVAQLYEYRYMMNKDGYRGSFELALVLGKEIPNDLVSWVRPYFEQDLGIHLIVWNARRKEFQFVTRRTKALAWLFAESSD